MKKFSLNLNETEKNWVYNIILNIKTAIKAKNKNEAEEKIKKIIEKIKNNNSSGEKYNILEYKECVNESYSYALIKNKNYSIGIYSYTNGNIDFWKMLDSGTGSPIELAVDKNYPLDKSRPYLFSWDLDDIYAIPIDLTNIVWTI